tara:strand:+ start:362 stop:775 length:414 start_codon:yes stop_codon:yes gene_type:complete
MKNFFALFTVLILIASCQTQINAPTNNAPTIKTLTIVNTNIQKADGAILEFIYEFTDDNGLNQFRVSVYDNFLDARLLSAPWNYDKDHNLSGTSMIDTLQIALPYPDIELGRYELTITVQDIDGEETSQKNTFYVID